MKPRIYFFRGNIEEQTFDSQILQNLNEINDISADWNSTKAYLYIGFQAILNEDVQNALADLPVGLYCSASFVDANPGQNWTYSKPLNQLFDNEKISKIFVVSSSIRTYKAPENSCEEIKNLEISVGIGDRVSEKEKGSAKIEDLLLSHMSWTARTENVFNATGLKYLSQLVIKSEAELLRVRNLGRKSVNEIKAKLFELGLELGSTKETFITPNENRYENDQDASSDIVIKLLKENIIGNSFREDIRRALTEKVREVEAEVLLHRSGLLGKIYTLEEIGTKKGVSRERIRQIEERALAKIFINSQNLLNAWYDEISKICYPSHYPVKISDIHNLDSRFDDLEEIEDLINFVIDVTNKKSDSKSEKTIRVINFLNKKVISFISEPVIESIKSSIGERLENNAYELLEGIKLECEKIITSDQKQFFEAIWDNEIANCHTSNDEGGNIILISYVGTSKINQGISRCKDYLVKNKEPAKFVDLFEIVKKENIDLKENTLRNAIMEDKDFYLVKHGEYDLYAHLKVTDNEYATIIKEANKIAQQKKGMQFHSREVLGYVEEVLIRSFTEFSISAVLIKSGKFTPLGRNAFTSIDSKLNSRILVNDVLIEILEKNERPMHSSELLQEAERYRGIDYKGQIQPKSPLKLLGGSYFVLDYWDKNILGDFNNEKYLNMSNSKKVILAKLEDKHGTGNWIDEATFYSSVDACLDDKNEKSIRTIRWRLLNSFQELGFIDKNGSNWRVIPRA